jgi:hypothetical protein
MQYGSGEKHERGGSMKRLFFLLLILGPTVSGCFGKNTVQPEQGRHSEAAPAVAAAEYYAEERHNDRVYVFGKSGTHEAFRSTHHMPYTMTLIGRGPKGETVVIEVDKKDPELQQRLLDTFKKRNLYYAEERHSGRIYVLGSASTHEAFRTTHHLPYTMTLIGAGPDGVTVVLEVDKKNPHVQQRLREEFEQRHGLSLK